MAKAQVWTQYEAFRIDDDGSIIRLSPPGTEKARDRESCLRILREERIAFPEAQLFAIKTTRAVFDAEDLGI